MRLAFLLLALLGSGAASAQSTVEYGGLAGGSATGAAQHQKTGKEIGGVWNSLSKTLQGSSAPAAKRAPARAKKAAPAVTPAPTVHEDPSAIPTGIAYDDVVRRFGTPSFEVTTGPHTKTLSYQSKDGGVDVDLQDGAVLKVAKAQ